MLYRWLLTLCPVTSMAFSSVGDIHVVQMVVNPVSCHKQGT